MRRVQYNEKERAARAFLNNDLRQFLVDNGFSYIRWNNTYKTGFSVKYELFNNKNKENLIWGFVLNSQFADLIEIRFPRYRFGLIFFVKYKDVRD